MSAIFVLLAILAAFIAGVYFGIAKMMGDVVIHNRVMATYDPVGIHKWLRMSPEMSTCYGVLATIIMLMFFFLTR